MQKGFLQTNDFLVCSDGHCVIVSVRDVLSCMMLVGVLCVFRVFPSQYERCPRDVQRTLQNDSRNNAPVARQALSSTGGAEGDQSNQTFAH